MASTQTQQRQAPSTATDAALLAAVIAILGSALMPSFALPALTTLLVADRSKAGIAALRVALSILEEYPAPPMQGIGAAQTTMIRENELRRSAYLVSSVARLRREIEQARAVGASLDDAEVQVRDAERRYFQQHVAASAQRMQSATLIDDLSVRYGPVLGWYAAKDGKVTAECKNADGKNFSALIPPAIGWPGVVHVNCRCRPGKPHRRGEMLA